MPEHIALTVDLEPDWGVRGTRALREVTPRFLRLLERRGARATFFVVGELMGAAPDQIAALGERNEIASHGSSHRTLDGLPGEEARRELRDSRLRLQQCGQPVTGFRAPFFRRRPGLLRMLESAGYRYDASMGSVFPGPQNGRLAALPCPARRGGLYEFPTSAMAGGTLPLSLTWLRVLGRRAIGQIPPSASLMYLHLHEFLPAETASVLPWHLRAVLARNCGEPAWSIFEAALDALGAEPTTCCEMLDEAR